MTSAVGGFTSLTLDRWRECARSERRWSRRPNVITATKLLSSYDQQPLLRLELLVVNVEALLPSQMTSLVFRNIYWQFTVHICLFTARACSSSLPLAISKSFCSMDATPYVFKCTSFYYSYKSDSRALLHSVRESPYSVPIYGQLFRVVPLMFHLLRSYHHELSNWNMCRNPNFWHTSRIILLILVPTHASMERATFGITSSSFLQCSNPDGSSLMNTLSKSCRERTALSQPANSIEAVKRHVRLDHIRLSWTYRIKAPISSKAKQKQGNDDTGSVNSPVSKHRNLHTTSS